MNQSVSKIALSASLILLVPALLVVGAIWRPELQVIWQDMIQGPPTMTYSRWDRCKVPLQIVQQAQVNAIHEDTLLLPGTVGQPETLEVEQGYLGQVEEVVTAIPKLGGNNVDRPPTQEEYQQWMARLNRVVEEIDSFLLEATKKEEPS